MPTLNTIREIASEVIAGADKDRGYSVIVTPTDSGEGFNIELSFIREIRYDKERDPQISREPEEVHDKTTEYLPVSVSENMVRAFVQAMIDDLTPIKYE